MKLWSRVPQSYFDPKINLAPKWGSEHFPQFSIYSFHVKSCFASKLMSDVLLLWLRHEFNRRRVIYLIFLYWLHREIKCSDKGFPSGLTLWFRFFEATLNMKFILWTYSKNIEYWKFNFANNEIPSMNWRKGEIFQQWCNYTRHLLNRNQYIDYNLCIYTKINGINLSVHIIY